MTAPAKENAPIPSGLPKLLRPWSHAFQDMPEAHLRLIGDLMGQLNPLLEEAFAVDAQSVGEFNGYDGMALRGDIERLLPSEWLWKELAPEEFLRRFAEQELLYHRPFFEEPTDERTHIVIVDCGAAMLGRPRLIALVALLCLNANARRQSAKLLWIAPHASAEGWQAMLRRENLKAFLLSASAASISSAQLDGLLQSLPVHDPDAELVLWTIGAAPLMPASETIKTNQIVISERMAPASGGPPVAEASVRLIFHSGRRKDAAFAFPAEEACVSLLREPFRPPASMRGLSRTAPAQRPSGSAANSLWAPHEVTFQRDSSRLIARVRDGLLSLKLTMTGALADPVFMPLTSYGSLLGVHWTDKTVHLALTRKYNTFSMLQLWRQDITRSSHRPQKGVEELRLEEDHPLVVDKHPRDALPPLIRPSKRQRFLAVTASGALYEIERSRVRQHAQVPQLALIGYRGEWAFLRSGEPERPLVVARNLATSQCATFAVPPDAVLSDLADILWGPEDLFPSETIMTLLARCEDGYWRGSFGRPRLAAREHFPPVYSEVDLSSLGVLFPLHLLVRADSPVPYHGVHAWNSHDRCFQAVSPDVNVTGPAASVGDFQVFGMTAQDGASPDQHRLRAMVCRSFLITWQSDDQGHVTRIEGGYKADQLPPAEKEPRSFNVEDLLGTATCLSE